MKLVAGVPLASFEDPIRLALHEYSDRSDGTVRFNIDAAADLELTPDRPNSARSATPVEHLGETIGTLFVIAFAPEDGTGDESAYALTPANRGIMYPASTKTVPRSKASTHSEVHLTIASQQTGNAQGDPKMYTGSLDLLGFRIGRIAKQATLGYDTADTWASLRGEKHLEPRVTYTTGYHQSGERFGDPHAVFNADLFLVQVCGFFAISHDVASQHASALPALGATVPDLRY